MSENNAQSTMGDPESSGTDFAEDVKGMVADHAPRRFAVVLEYGEQVDAAVYAWGIVLDSAAYMTTADGKSQYSMTSAEGALKYVPARQNTTPHLVWVDAEPAE